ncbi:MAG: STAS domain-containing protein [Phycisphaeraceae bacterium]|nr:STAS domain-containing protein [Phycisphaeraceae bacterium]
MREFVCHWREEEGVDVIAFAGAIGSRSATLFGAVLEALSQSPTRDLRIDCDRVTFMASASVGQLVKLVNDVRGRGGRVTLEPLPVHLSELFRRMRLETFLGADPDRSR